LKVSKKQREVLNVLQDKHTKEIIFGGGAGGSKSFIGCYWILKSALRYPETRWLIGRAKLKTLKETTLNSFWEVCKIQGVTPEAYKYNSQSGTIRFFNGSEILLKDLFAYPSDPNFDELGSLEITGAFIDECNQIVEKAWNITKSRIRFKLDDYGLIPKMLGTCNPSKNWVYNNFYKPFVQGVLKKDQRFIKALVGDNPFISQHYVEQLKTLDINSQKRLLHGDWEYDDDPTKLMEYDKILDLFTNDFVLMGNKYITCDVARFGDDKTVIILWDGLRAEQIKAYGSTSIDFVVNEINTLRKEHGIGVSNVVVDEDGVGGGVRDFLKCQGFVNNSKPVLVSGKKQNFKNLKSQCYFLLAEYVNNAKIFVNCKQVEYRDSIVQELEVVRGKQLDTDNKLATESKDKVKDLIGRSPDFSDALMMRMYFELKKTKTLINFT